ncbi:MAG: hypothetical protein CSA21_04035 [Deltaproteobacteria bacterium]|nr:MAG: hypothetical protein CSA21_04035 [Deltaproteobacteria bacterium]
MSKDRYILSATRTYCNFCPGYCCYRLPGSVLLLDNDDINRIARYFAIPDGEVRRRFLDGRNTFRNREDGSCLFLSNKKMCRRCTIHEARPRQCREFPAHGPCPYLDSPRLMEATQKRVERALLGNPLPGTRIENLK